MKINKNIVSIISILLFFSACSQKDTKVEMNAKKSANENEIVDAISPYRKNLRLFGRFKEKVPIVNSIKEIKDGKCVVEGYSKNGKEFCKTAKNSKTIYEESPCKENNFMKIEEIVKSTDDKNITTETLYKCIDSREEKEEKGDRYWVYEDKRYISVSDIINKSSSSKLPKNLDTLVKNAINNISSNYILIDVEEIPKDNEYRIEGAITGFDEPYARSDSKSGNVYAGKGQGEFDIAGGNNNGTTIAELSIDFIMKKYNTELGRWIYVKDVSTSKKIKLLKTNKGYAFSFGVLGGGIALSESISRTNGLAYITRALVERSMLELLAKLDDLPYWSFLPNPLKNIDENWNKKLIQKHQKDIVKKSGFYPPFIKNLLNIWNPRNKGTRLSSRIKYYKEYYSVSFNGQVNGKIDEKLVVHLLNNIPIVLNGGRLEQKNKSLNNDFAL